MRLVRYLLLLILLVISAQGVATVDKKALIITVNGAISPANIDFVQRGIQQAEQEHAIILVLMLDTPGGLDKSMRMLIKSILASAVPVVTYVAPSGARAASAGTYILYASHIAAMAPGTHLGAATPVQLGGGFNPMPAQSEKKDTQPEKNEKTSQPAEQKKTASKDSATAATPQPPKDAMKQKLVNDALAYIRGLAELRHRNADWAEEAVRDAASITATEALAINVIDVVASDLDDLFAKINGKVVLVKNQEIRLETTDLTIEHIIPDWRTKLLAVITDPNVAYILMLIGLYGLLLEGYNPGYVLPGVVGAIALLLALYAFQLLPFSYAAMGLIFLGIALMIAEAMAPSFGILGIGGVVAFVLGSVFLFDGSVPGLGISLGLIAGLTISTALFTLLMLGMIVKARKRRVVSGKENMLGQIAVVIGGFPESGEVSVLGERWQASCEQPLQKKQKVRITNINGLYLTVEPFNEGEEP